MTHHSSRRSSQAGFSLPELLIAVTILLIISSAVTSALLQMTNSQRTIWNRTQLHAGVRSATELLQQEVGQAGANRAARRGDVGCRSADWRADGGREDQRRRAGDDDGLFRGRAAGRSTWAGRRPVSSVQPCQETVTCHRGRTSPGKQITATFAYPHDAGAAVQALGGFGDRHRAAARAGYPERIDRRRC